MTNYPPYQQYPGKPTQWGQWTPTSPIPQEDRSAAALAHSASLIAMVFSLGWLSFVGPLVMWILYKDRSPYVRKAAAGAFNFNIWANVMMIVGQLLTFTLLFAWIGIPLMVIAAVLMVWTHLRGTMRSLRGEPYTYRHQLRILS